MFTITNFFFGGDNFTRFFLKLSGFCFLHFTDVCVCVCVHVPRFNGNAVAVKSSKLNNNKIV